TISMVEVRWDGDDSPRTVDSGFLEAVKTSKEVRVTDPNTGGQKLSKPEQPGQIPPRFLLGLGRVYSFGNGKYPDAAPGQPNWSRGYSWSLSINAFMRHFLAWLSGEDDDPESGESHLLHAAWHLGTLYTFQTEGLGTDDRPTYYRDKQEG